MSNLTKRSQLRGEVLQAHQDMLDAFNVCENARQSGIDAMLRTGEALIAYKAVVPHGQWESTVEAEMPFGPREARELMQIAHPKNRKRIEAKRNRGSDLTRHQLRILIRDKPDDEEDADAVITDIQAADEAVKGSTERTRSSTGGAAEAPLSPEIEQTAPPPPLDPKRDEDSTRPAAPHPAGILPEGTGPASAPAQETLASRPQKPPPKPDVGGQARRRSRSGDDDEEGPPIPGDEVKAPPKKSSFDKALEMLRGTIVDIEYFSNKYNGELKTYIGRLTRAADTLAKYNPSAAAVEAPDWLDADLWIYFIVARNKYLKRKSKPAMTAGSARLTLQRLDKQFRQRGIDPNDVLRQSLERDWIDLYDPKQQANGTDDSQRRDELERKYGGLFQ